MDHAIFNPSNYHLNSNAVAPISVALILFGMSIYLFFKEIKNAISIVFILYLFGKGIWLSGMAIVYSTKNYAIAEIIFKNYVFLGVVILPPTLYFYISSLSNLNEKNKFIINYMIALVFYFVNLKTDYIYLSMKEYSYGYYPIFTTFGSLSFLAYFYGNAFICFKNLIKKIKTINIIEEKNRINNIIVGLIIGHIAGIDYLPAIGINSYPYGYILIIIMITYIFSAKPWLSIKNESLLEHKQEENDTFIFDDNINKIPKKYGLQAFK